MTKSGYKKISSNQDQLPPRDVEQAVRMIIEKCRRLLLIISALKYVALAVSLHYRAHRWDAIPKLVMR